MLIKISTLNDVEYFKHSTFPNSSFHLNIVICNFGTSITSGSIWENKKVTRAITTQINNEINHICKTS
jgi:hypothetical protein